jgi:hypothetical protein
VLGEPWRHGTLLSLVLALYPLLGTGAPSGTALLLLWGLAYGGVSVSLQS